jgi:hypothetical protein
MRKSVRSRSRRLRDAASSRASTNCGTVASRKMPKVLKVAFQKTSSDISFR